MGKLIVIEGTDCSGKETQTNKLVKRLTSDGYKVNKISFPVYDSPTGIILGACLLGKPDMCNKYLKTDKSFFKEGGGNVDSLTASMLYAADRRYNLELINKMLNENDILILDRYVYSNMAHRGGMIKNKEERLKFYKKLELLEFDINELPKPDEVYLLYMPYELGETLRKNRPELLDEAEMNKEYLINAEKTYLELTAIYNYQIINCYNENKVKGIDEIHNDLYMKIKKKLK